ncbi:hypothetical protein [Streptomyces sp. NPDC000880]
MNLPHSQPLAAAARAATRRTAAVVVLVLLALLGTSFGSGVAATGGAATWALASAPAPAGGDQPEETDTDVSPAGSGLARPVARYVAPDTQTGLATAEPVPYRPGRSRQAELALPLRAVRCVVLRC